MTVVRGFAMAGVGLAMAGVIGTVTLRSVSPAPIISSAFGFGWPTVIGYLIQGVLWASVGALLVVRRPENAVGWLMVLVGVGYAVSQLTVSMASSFAAANTAEGDRLAQIAGWFTVLLQLVTILHFAIGFLFPDGHVQSPRWQPFMRFFWAFAAVFVVLSLIQPGPLQLIPALDNPFGFGPDLRAGRPISPILIVAAVVIFVALVISMASRYRSAGAIERQQLKLFVLALGVSAIGLGIASSEAIFTDRPENAIGLTVYVYAGAVVPGAIGIAIFRYRLYEFDRLISRGVSWAVLSWLLLAVYVSAVILLQGLLGGVTQGDALAVAGSTLLAAALFQPLRWRIQAVVDRRFYRARYDAERTTEAFATRLRDQLDLTTLTDELQGTAVRAVEPSGAVIWLRSSSPRPPAS